ncbi:type IV secretory system conjugative DNA transfer family protein [Priestia aryabhattai]|uniref:type IV secretory system conjugative DNA transfer family protein n=3 Tax=Priestia aryabhattai TaxID=412384 RepID=UPI003D2C1239
MHDPALKNKRNDDLDTTGVIFIYALGALVFVLLSIGCLFGLILVAIAKIIKSDKWLYFLSPIAILGILFLYQNDKLYSTLGTLKYVPVLKQYFQKMPDLDIWALIAGFLVGIILATGFRIWEVYFNKKVVSKKAVLDEKRATPFYKRVRKKKELFIRRAEKKHNNEVVSIKLIRNLSNKFNENASLKKYLIRLEKKHKKDIFLGITEFNEIFTVTEKELNQHTLIVGTTGSGKTILIILLMLEAIKRGKPVIAIDGKGDSDFVKEVATLAKQEGKKLYVFSEYSGYTYNPIKNGTPTMVRDKIMSLFTWSNEYYTNHCSNFLQLLIQIFDKFGVSRDLKSVYKYTDQSKLMDLLEQQHEKVIEKVLVEDIDNKVKEDNPKEDKDVIDVFGLAPKTVDSSKEVTENEEPKYKEVVKTKRNPIADEFQEELESIPDDVIQGLKTQLGELVRSDLGPLFEEKESGIDLRKIVEEKAMVVFSVDGLAYSDYVDKLSRLVIMDINNLCSYLYKTGRQSVFAVFDEFSCYVNKNVVDTVNKARGAGLEAVIGTQGLCDIDAISPALTKQIVNNCNLHVAMRVNEGTEAEALAKTIGTYEDIDLTIQTKEMAESEMGTSRQVERFKAHPNTIKELRTGEAIISQRAKEGLVNKVYIKYPFEPKKSKRRLFFGNFSKKVVRNEIDKQREKVAEK